MTAQEQDHLSRRPVEEGCRFAACMWCDCSSWDDSIDMVGVMDEIEDRPGPFVMTTWHDSEPTAEVVGFFASLMGFDDWHPEAHAVLIVGGPDDLEREVRAAVKEAFA